MVNISLFFIYVNLTLLFCNTNGYAVLVVLSVWLHGVSLGFHDDAVLLDTELGREDSAHSFCTLLGVGVVNFAVTRTLVSVARYCNLGFRILLQVGNDILYLVHLLLTDL